MNAYLKVSTVVIGIAAGGLYVHAKREQDSSLLAAAAGAVEAKSNCCGTAWASVEPSNVRGGPPVKSEPQSDENPLSRAEKLLAVYDELSDMLEAGSDDCEATAYGMSTLIDGRAHELRALGQHASMPEQPGQRLGQDALAVARSKIQRFNDAFARAMPHCSAQLLPELKRLSAVGAAP